MKRGWMLGIVVCMTAFSAEAKTVAWWRFGDLGPPGGAAGAAPTCGEFRRVDEDDGDGGRLHAHHGAA